jgi:hypothetical protein
VITVLIDGLMSKPSPSKGVLQQYATGIQDLGKDAELILHRAARKGNVKIVGFLLVIVQAAEHTDTVYKLLLT